MTLIELVATVAGFLCVLLYIRQNILSWPIGLVQVVLYIYVFYNAKLYSDMILHFIYVGLQFYGWYHWLNGDKKNKQLQVSTLSMLRFVNYMLISVAGTALIGYLMAGYTDAALPYADAMIMSTSLVAQWLIARKILETWIFWILVDVVAIGVFLQKELYFTTALYSLFLIMATMGLFAWRRSYYASRIVAVNSAAP